MAVTAFQIDESHFSAPYRWVPQDCPVCGPGAKRLLGRRGGSAHRMQLGIECQIWRCQGCQLIFPDPMPMPTGGIEQNYDTDPDEFFKEHQSEDKERSAVSLLTRAKQLLNGTGRLLDIGSGRGELLRTATQSGWDAVGIEPSATFAERAKENSGAEVHRQPLERCSFESGSFDCVMLAAVLEHLYNPDETIAAVERVLRRGGVLFVDVPNEQGLYFRIGNLYERLRGRDWVVNLAPTFSPYHVFGFGPKSLRALLNKYRLQPHDWRVYPGQSMVPAGPGLVGEVERLAARAVTALSKLDSLGTYIETWAVKI